MLLWKGASWSALAFQSLLTCCRLASSLTYGARVNYFPHLSTQKQPVSVSQVSAADHFSVLPLTDAKGQLAVSMAYTLCGSHTALLSSNAYLQHRKAEIAAPPDRYYSQVLYLFRSPV